MTAATTAARAFLDSLATEQPRNGLPLQLSDPAHEGRAQRYSYLEAWYTGDVLDIAAFRAVKGDRRLYRNTRILVNLNEDLVDFYGYNLHPGSMSSDGLPLPGGKALAFPLASDTPEPLRKAIAHWVLDNNYHVSVREVDKLSAMLGNCLVRLVDNPDRGKVTMEIVDPRKVASVTLDDRRNVRAYVLEYPIDDPHESPKPGKAPRRILYREEVDQTAVRVYHVRATGRPQPSDRTLIEAYDNPYGFVPACWYQHTPGSSVYNLPAMGYSDRKLLELNSIMSHLHDGIHKQIANPVLIASQAGQITQGGVKKSGEIAPLGEAEKVNPYDPESQDRESMMLLLAPAGTAVHSLGGTWDATAANTAIERLHDHILQRYPEITYWRDVREMGDPSGRAVDKLRGDVDARVNAVGEGHDLQNVKLIQMAIAISGWRLYNGDWSRDDAGNRRELTSQQLVYKPFDLTSYGRGLLSFTLDRQPLVAAPEPTEPEKLEIAERKKALGLKPRVWLADLGLTEADLEEPEPVSPAPATPAA